jgi:hypothetical protein
VPFTKNFLSQETGGIFDIKPKGTAIIFTISIPCLVAYTLGITSPINRIIAVIRNTSIMKRINDSLASAGNIIFSNELVIITIATFTKLLVIKMVASKSCGLLISSRARFAFLVVSNFNFSLSAGSNEKKATSEAAIKLEHVRSIKIVIELKIIAEVL